MAILAKYKSMNGLTMKTHELLKLCRRHRSCGERSVQLKPQMSAKQIRTSFIDYFVGQHNHSFVRSSGVLPENDSSLLFVSAGMNQFKDIFQNRLSPTDPRNDLKRCVNTQKCIRVGGKHCDLSTVGTDGRHHTFFEMLGNWSFGDYYKKESCLMALDLLTRVYKLDVNRLIATYFGGDADLGLGPDLETKDIWLGLGLPEHRVIPLGAKENFWEMGETGPCGICTELHYQMEPNSSLDSKRLLDSSIEIWNIVFMQFDRKSNGNFDPLHKHFVDTGMGFERITSVIQNVKSNYETDLFFPYFDIIQKISHCRAYSSSYSDLLDTSYRILADHSRMFTIAISDGLLPGYRGNNFILRKLIRKSLGMTANDFGIANPRPLFDQLVDITEHLLSDAFPELTSNAKHVKEVIAEEIDKYDAVVLDNKRIVRTLKQINIEYSVNLSEEIAKRLKSMDFEINSKVSDQSIDKLFLDECKRYLFGIKDLMSDYTINLRHNLQSDVNESVDQLMDKIKELEEETNSSFLKELQSIANDSQYIVYEIKTRGDTKIAFKLGLDCLGHKPTAFFHMSADDSQFSVQTTVPNAYQKSMKANEWMSRIAEKLESFEISSNKRAHKISTLKSNSIRKLKDAIDCAKQSAQTKFC